MTKNQAQLFNLRKKVNNLKEVLVKLKSVSDDDRDVFRDSSIQRFEIAFDVCWKTLKEVLRIVWLYSFERVAFKKTMW